ncbi:MAG: hypothetical protein HKN23_16395 [Verrucomicrobiales bacterium]|nr:hypothetical protein [Verrucomicrobiales bacterium]
MSFLIALILGILALVGNFVPTIPVIGVYEFWLAIAAYLVLAAGNTMKGF